MTDDPIRTRIAGFDGPCGETVWRTLKTGQCSRSGLCGPRLAIRVRQKKGAGTKQMLHRWPACGSSFAVLAVNHRTRIARDRDHKQQNAESQKVMRNDTWCAEQACTETPKPQCPVDNCRSRTHAAEVVRPLSNS